MSLQNLESRRRLLKFFASAPMLPLGGTEFSTALLAGCGGNDDTPAVTYTASSFTGMAAPTLSAPDAMATTSVGSSLNVAYSGGSKKSYALAHRPGLVSSKRNGREQNARGSFFTRFRVCRAARWDAAAPRPSVL